MTPVPAALVATAGVVIALLGLALRRVARHVQGNDLAVQAVMERE